MLLVFDIDSKRLVQAAGSQAAITSIECRRGGAEEIAIQVVTNGAPAELTGDAPSLKFQANAAGEYDVGSTTISTTTFTYDSVAELYRGYINWIDGGALDALFVDNDDPDDDVASVALEIEVAWRPDGLTEWRRSENEVDLTLLNNRIRDGVDVPSTTVSSAIYTWLPRMPFTGYTGGAATALDSMITASDTVLTGSLAFTVVAGVARMWQLVAGTTAENEAAGVIRPDDYHASTNARIWQQVAWQ